MIPTHNFRGYTLIEMVVVMVLIAILAGFSIQAIILSTETYTITVREYLELFKEGYLAMDRMVREIRETRPEWITIAGGSISFTKPADHETPHDPSLAVTFAQSGNVIERQTASGTFQLTGNVAAGSFIANMNEQSAVTLSFTLSGANSQIPLRSAVYPRQGPTPIPTPTPAP